MAIFTLLIMTIYEHLCVMKWVLWALVRFFYERVCPCVWRIDVKNWQFILVNFSFDHYKVFFFMFFDNFGRKFILFYIRMATLDCFGDHLPEKLFSNFILWGIVLLCHWVAFPVCSKMLGLVYLSSLWVCVFLFRNLLHWF